MAFLESIRGYTYQFLSLIQRCPHSRPAAHAAMDLVLRRKAIGAEALAVQRDAALSGKYPALREGFAQLHTLICQTAQKMLAGPGEESVDEYRQRLSKWVAERELLEAELASQIPEMSFEQQLKAAELSRLSLALSLKTQCSLSLCVFACSISRLCGLAANPHGDRPAISHLFCVHKSPTTL